MGRCLKQTGLCFLAVVLIWAGGLLADKKQLKEDLIRFHVVANSDSSEDQKMKLKVRDAVLQHIQRDLEKVSDVQEARVYLQENLPRIRQIAGAALDTAGVDTSVAVTLCREAFDIRRYDTFSLPAGVYESLRIVIGEGEGQNWWCVAFPGLCIPENRDTFVETAVQSGLSDTLTETLCEEKNYEVRFFLLDQLGRMENIFFEG